MIVFWTLVVIVAGVLAAFGMNWDSFCILIWIYLFIGAYFEGETYPNREWNDLESVRQILFWPFIADKPND